jgi:hypothetical protein
MPAGLSIWVFNLTGGDMKTSDVVAEFGGVKALADALGIWPQAVYRWGDTVPPLRRYQIEHLRRAKVAAPVPDGAADAS